MVKIPGGARTLKGYLSGEKLEKAVTQKGNIRIDKSMTESQLRGINKAVDLFLKRTKSSTVRGIKQTIKNQKARHKGIYERKRRGRRGNI